MKNSPRYWHGVALLIAPATGHTGGATFRDRGPMTHAAGLLTMALFLVGLLWAAPASASEPRLPLPNPGPLELVGYCEGFTVLITWTEFNQYIIRAKTSSDGTTTLKITGNAQATVTNETTGKAVSFNVSGPGTLVIFPSGAFSINAAGPNLLWTLPENLLHFPDVPTISYTTGHVTVEVDASGQTTAYALAGGARQTDVCEALTP